MVTDTLRVYPSPSKRYILFHNKRHPQEMGLPAGVSFDRPESIILSLRKRLELHSDSIGKNQESQ